MKYTGNELCDICIDIMQWWSNNTTLTYGEINVLLFIIIQPILVFVSAFFAIYTYFKKSITILVLDILMIALYIIGTIILVGLPILDICLEDLN